MSDSAARSTASSGRSRFRTCSTSDYFDYAAASTATFGRYNAYPQPGRTFQARAGMTF